jgi:hypothetical protein
VQAILRDSRDMNLYITAEQHVGAGIRESTGAFSGDGLRFR